MLPWMAERSIAVISDIHGNAVAFEAVLQNLERYPADEVVCLGDTVQGGTQPREVVDLLKVLGCPVILGNADAYVLEGAIKEDSTEAVSEPMKQIRDWTYEQLGEDGRKFLSTYLSLHEVEITPGVSLFCFHGTPDSYDGVLLPQTSEEELRSAFAGHDAPFMCGGHTHIQWTVAVDGTRFFNPGSVGLAYNRFLEQEEFFFYPLAEYAMVIAEGDTVRIEFCHVPYDVDQLEKAALASGRPFSENEGAKYRPKV
jgi:predicted phosphodiesterase